MIGELRFLTARFITNFFAVLAVVAFVPNGLDFPQQGTRGFWTAILSLAVVLALLNSYVRPVIDMVLKPLTCLFGLVMVAFVHLVISVAVFWVADLLVEEIAITSVRAGVIGAVIVGGVGLAGSLLLGGRSD